MRLVYDSKQPAKVALTFPPGATVDVPDEVVELLLLDPHWKPESKSPAKKPSRKAKADTA